MALLSISKWGVAPNDFSVLAGRPEAFRTSSGKAASGLFEMELKLAAAYGRTTAPCSNAGSFARLLDLICFIPSQRLMSSQIAASGAASGEPSLKPNPNPNLKMNWCARSRH